MTTVEDKIVATIVVVVTIIGLSSRLTVQKTRTVNISAVLLVRKLKILVTVTLLVMNARCACTQYTFTAPPIEPET